MQEGKHICETSSVSTNFLLMFHLKNFSTWVSDIYSNTGETCVNKMSDGSCQSIFIPDCEDRNVYCSNLQKPANSTKILITQPVPGLNIMGTVVTFTCTNRNWYFNYTTPPNLVSFYYSTNINTSTLSCNNYG